MNYFRAKSALIAGIQAVPVQVECAQSRRLPYIQIIGGAGKAASELRERVIAAIDSSGLRIPARRITVQLQPPVHGLPLEHLDLAVAVAILGSSGLIPASRVENLLICGALSLDGGIRPTVHGSALRRLLREGGYASAILPWIGSEILEESQLRDGGGFRTLAEVVRFARGSEAGQKCRLDPESMPPPPERVWERIEGQAVAKRMLEIAAAGGHHLLLPGPDSARVDLLAHALSLLLPPLGEAETAEVRSIYALAGMETCPSRPFHAFASTPGIPPLLQDRRLGKVEEILLAHRGVLFVDRVCEREPLLFPGMLGPMHVGTIRSRVGQRMMELPADPLILATTSACGCGARGDGLAVCTCRPTEAKRYQERWRRLLRYPFDLVLPIASERGAQFTEEPLQERAGRVQRARARIWARQGKGNARLQEFEALQAKPWKKCALQLLQVLNARSGGQNPLARVALTISDLREGAQVEERDFFEAKHYFPEAGGLPEGNKAARVSAPEANSIAIP